MGIVGSAGAAAPELGFDSVDGLFDTRRGERAVHTIAVGIDIDAITAAACRGGNGGIGATHFKNAPAAGERAAIGVEVLHQGQHCGAAVGAEFEIGAVAGVASGTDVVESATIIGVGVEAGDCIGGVIGIVPSAVLFEINGIVAAGGGGRPTQGGIGGVESHHRGGAGHIEASGSQPYLYIVDIH